ncbi:unnamed protein product [Prorocentrum cordatum]|uniref:Uncharacterized protein n=1 Tax=Prorocentrum cordatum TaxID=2364126 RepID=A0ABN9YCJ4_9DINO|nr:unnamed protein product [Polarella glacialis]
MVPAPWTWSGKQQQESKQDWMCKFCTFRRTGAPLINYRINEKCYKCKLHKGVAFKRVAPSDLPSRSKRKADGTNDAAAASFAKLEKRLQQLEAENAKLRGSPDTGGGDAAVETNESEELRDEIDGLGKHVQRLESVRSPWAVLPLKAAREQLEGARRNLYENKPLPAKLTALSRRAEQARIRYQKAEQDKAAADQKLLKAQGEAKAAARVVLERQKVCLQLDEEVRALASSQPAEEPGQHQSMDLTGPEIKLDGAKLLAALGEMEGVAGASKLAPKLAEVLKSCAAELLEEPPDRRARVAASGGQPAEPPPAAWNIDAIEVEQLREPVPVHDVESLGRSSTCAALSKLQVAGDKQPIQSFGVSTEFTVVCYNSNSWATAQSFMEWCVLDQLLQADIFVLPELRLTAGEQILRATVCDHWQFGFVDV